MELNDEFDKIMSGQTDIEWLDRFREFDSIPLNRDQDDEGSTVLGSDPIDCPWADVDPHEFGISYPVMAEQVGRSGVHGLDYVGQTFDIHLDTNTMPDACCEGMVHLIIGSEEATMRLSDLVDIVQTLIDELPECPSGGDELGF